MQTKLSKLKAAWDAGDRLEALRIAAKFPQLGPHKQAIHQAWNAHQNPSFYREIGRDPDALLEAGYTALAERYKLS